MNAADELIAIMCERAFGGRYPFFGTSPMVDCGLCGALVLQEDRMKHAKWHAALEGVTA